MLNRKKKTPPNKNPIPEASEAMEKLEYGQLANISALQASHIKFLKENALRNSLVSKWALMLATGFFIFGVVFFVKYNQTPIKNNYFTVDSKTGVVTNTIFPLNEPVLTDTAVKSQSDGCMRVLFDVDYLHFKYSFKDNSNCFTPAGFLAFVTEVYEKDGGIFKILEDKKLVSSITPALPLSVTEKRVKRGVYTWTVVGYYKISHNAGRSTVTRSEIIKNYNVKITTVLKRVSNELNPAGVAISSMILEEGSFQ